MAVKLTYDDALLCATWTDYGLRHASCSAEETRPAESRRRQHAIGQTETFCAPDHSRGEKEGIMGRKRRLICPNCGREAQRLVTPPLPPRLSMVAPRYSGPVCERCLEEIEQEYTRDRAAARPES